ncbi:MAG TPA: ClbS/DfsB family four-helix bundle protein [Chloroflexia bacterium]|nr:ClbS/DfsB family four-helix bundle protein [Chloroflexia bacterium]
MEKRELLRELHAEQARLEAALAQLSATDLAVAGVWESWSVKDILAHLTVWDGRGTVWIRTAAQGEPPAIPLPGRTWQDLDALNAATYQENLPRPADAVLADYRQTFAALIAQLEALTAADWARAYRLHPGADPTSVAALAGWRLGHLRNHSQPIHTWVAQRRKAD